MHTHLCTDCVPYETKRPALIMVGWVEMLVLFTLEKKKNVILVLRTIRINKYPLFTERGPALFFVFLAFVHINMVDPRPSGRMSLLLFGSNSKSGIPVPFQPVKGILVPFQPIKSIIVPFQPKQGT